jgi:3'-phosphoadenosine 5'-phosphosulfate sulfotransferase (PAPS reductase)/FAD synthetase
MQKLTDITNPRPQADYTPDLASYDAIVVSTSAGKDSQATLSLVVDLATQLGIKDRVIAVHADLGRVEWEGTRELAERQAEYFGVEFRVTSRIGGVAAKDSKTYKAGEVYGDILDYSLHRNAFPDMSSRWCTSEFKRSPIQRVYTQVAKEWREKTGERRPCRILDCQGLRAEESPARKKKQAFSERIRTRTQHVDTWLPVHHWLVAEVWGEINRSGAPYHYAYNLGMPRLSCVFCIFAPKACMVLAGRHNRALLDEYIEVERKTGYSWRKDWTIESVRDAIEAGERGEATDFDDHGCSGMGLGDWNM